MIIIFMNFILNNQKNFNILINFEILLILEITNCFFKSLEI